MRSQAFAALLVSLTLLQPVAASAQGTPRRVGATYAFDPEQKLPDFAIDSDKAVATARKAGLAKPALRVTVRMFPVRNMGDRAVWQRSEGAGMGDKTIEVDAITGEIRNRIVIK